MHISEGVLSAPVLLAGAVLSLAGLTLGLRKIKNEDIPKVAVLSSAFFVASLIHIPVGPTSAHLVLNGLVGMLLGWSAFPAIFVGLVLQALLFQFGGLTTLGVNTFAMSMPAVLSYYIFRKMLKKSRNIAFIGGAFGGTSAVLIGTLFISMALIETEKSFFGVAITLFTMHLPVALIEGIITGFVVLYLKKVKPEALG
ncbi:MAG: cobalt transporter CbiM [Thermodesulfovibrio sp.]|nr:cobalt transporter CbiM [Thermodesulfovibrio sp.]